MDYAGGAAQGRGCYNCGDASHQARDCPTRGPAKCYNCGGEGHMSTSSYIAIRQDPC
ncbi:hypothetical protein BDZ45DRAFT_676748 [Acephala macrosclerotiorum]|nr:hypothetical protein BDZ45DRAFT_676748 [Acephala macrosclerotiorum]